MIISLLQEKGGAGKTTISINLAHSLQRKGFSVLLVDADAQGSARDWHQANGGQLLEVIGMDRPTIDKDLKQFRKRYDYIIIDGSPRLSEMAIKTIIASDIVLIPVQPSPYDVWASSSIVALIKQRQDITEGKPKAAFILSRQIVSTRIAKEARDALHEYNLPIFENGTYQRVIYSDTAKNGQTVLTSQDTRAKHEIEEITKEVVTFSGRSI